MMQYENFEPSWPFFNDIMSSNFDQVEVCDFTDSPINGSEFLSSFIDTESSPVSSETFSLTSGEIVQFPVHDFSQGIISPEEELEFPLGLEEMENIWSHEIESFLEQSPEQSDVPSLSEQSGLSFAGEDMEVDIQVGIVHLLRAYGGAMEEEQRELQDEISKCLREKVSPVGGSLDRLAFTLTREVEKEGDYLRQESCKNYEDAREAFYLISPYGRFAHMSANSAIVEAVPEDAETVHIVDFDLGDGVQWPSVMEAIARKHKAVKLTCIKLEEEEGAGSTFKFEDTKRRLSSYARSLGLKLKVEETKMDDLVSEVKKSKKRGGKKEWVGFNCMVGLPHMGKGRSRKLAMEFQCLAKELMANSADGILTVGDGDACGSHGLSFGSYFEGCLEHYKALLESMEMSFPEHLGEARLAVESLFVAPQICSQAWMRRWEEVREGCAVGLGMEDRRVSRENVMEAKEMVREGECLYGVRIGEKQNEMVLEWRGTPLVRMSAWRI